MTEQDLTVKLGRLALAMLTELDNIPAPKWSQVWEQQAVQIVSDAFDQAVRLNDHAETPRQT